MSKTEYSLTSLRKRLFAILIAITFIFLSAGARLFYIQIIWGKDLQKKAVDQWTRDLPVIAERGLIFDRNGETLAGNESTFSVFLRSRSVLEEEYTARTLAEILELDYEKTLKKIKNKNISEITLKRLVSKEQIENLSKKRLKGIYYSRDNKRIYPYGDFLSQVIGFTSVDNRGQSGVEGAYEKYLKGINGEVLYESDLLGKELDNATAKYIPAIKGMNITLTIDKDIQLFSEQAMQQAMTKYTPKSAKTIVLDVNSGEILAMANKPSLDLNNVPRDNIELLNSLNRNGIVVDIYEPGSTFKVLTAAANIEEYLQGNNKAFSNKHIFSSNRIRIIDGQKIKCWDGHLGGRHSNETLADALNNSCNPVFVDIAISLGKDTFYKYLDLFNYGAVTGIDFWGEAQGMVLPKSAIKNCDLARIGFGQTIAVTPLQLSLATASAVNGGKYYRPYLIKEISTSDKIIAESFQPIVKNRVISEKASKILAEMLEGVVEKGSGKKAYIEGYRVGGKTGTAQKYENGRIAEGKYVSSFVGFFPANKPQYLCLVVIDEPVGEHYGSTVASPYAKMIFENIIKKNDIKPFK